MKLKYVDVFMATIAAPADANMVLSALTQTRGVFPGPDMDMPDMVDDRIEVLTYRSCAMRLHKKTQNDTHKHHHPEDEVHPLTLLVLFAEVSLV